MTKEEFWQLAYLSMLNNSKEPLSVDRGRQAKKTADQAVVDLNTMYQEQGDIIK